MTAAKTATKKSDSENRNVSLQIYDINFISAGSFEVGYIAVRTNAGVLRLAPLQPCNMNEPCIRDIVDRLNNSVTEAKP